MFKLHKKVKYALSSLKYIKAKTGKELSTAKEICVRYKIPFDPTSRVLQLMTQNGLLEAVQGAYGGYRLKGDLTKVSLHELSRIVIGSIAITDCTSDDCECERINDCVLKSEMARLNDKMVKVFKDVKVSEMVNGGR